MTPNRRDPIELLGPLSTVALTVETAFQPSVEDQQARERLLTHIATSLALSRRTIHVHMYDFPQGD